MTHRKGSSDSVYTCKVRLFRDEESLEVKFQKHVTGEWLLDYVCGQLNLLEKYYFGLRYTDQNSVRRWLDLSGAVIKQVKDLVKDSICFRVRYYPASPALLKEDLTRYYLCMQLRRDAFHGRLATRACDVPALTALIMQSELGDFEDVELDTGFTKDIELLPKMASTMENQIINSYKELSGLSPAEAESRFIELVRSLDSYGIDQQSVKDRQGQQLHIGANHKGVALFQSFKRVQLIEWENITKCNIDGKSVSISSVESDGDEKSRKQVNKFKCSDEQAALSLWMCILDQQAFFTLHSHEQAKSVRSGGLFRRSNKFKFSGHCYDEVVDDSSQIRRLAPDFVRASSLSLNRSQSIRSSKRTLLKRGSLGSVPHSKSLPISFSEDSLNGIDEDNAALASQQENAVSEDEIKSEPNGEVLGESVESAEEEEPASAVLETAASSNTELVNTHAEKARLPVAVEMEITPLYQTRTAPQTPEILEMETTPDHQIECSLHTPEMLEHEASSMTAGSVTSGPTRTLPAITVTENTGKESSTLSHFEAAQEYASTSTSGKSDDDDDDDDNDPEHFEIVNCVEIPSENTANGSIRTEQLEKEAASANNSLVSNSHTSVDRPVGGRGALATEFITNSSTEVKSLPWLRIFIAFFTPLLLAIAMFAVLQSDKNYIEIINQSKTFQYIRDNYLIPFSAFIRRYL